MVARERGFTLLEVVVALTIGALVVLLAHELLGAALERSKTLTMARATLDRTMNARRWLVATFLSLDVGTEGGGGFEGRANHATFTTWLLTPDGWFERREVVLARESDRLAASLTPGSAIPLMDSVADVELDYLLEPGADSRWVREWVSPVSAPLAVRLRVRRQGKGESIGVDTLLCLIKERG